MFNIGPSEMFMLGLMVLLLFGPSRLPEIARAAGKGLRAFRQAATDIQREVREAVEAEENAGKESPKESPRVTPKPEPQPPPEGVAMNAIEQDSANSESEEEAAAEPDSPEEPQAADEAAVEEAQKEEPVPIKESS